MLEVAILSPFAHTNALGRAISLARIASPGLRLSVLAPPGNVWLKEAIPSHIPLYQLRQADIESFDCDAYWAVKPLPQSLGLASQLSKSTGRPFFLDIDDDDAGLARSYVNHSLRKWARLRMRGDSAGRIDAQIATHAGEAALLTSATYAVAERVLGATPGSGGRTGWPPLLRIPHPRHVSDEPARTSERVGPLKMGFLGTVRPHKGLATLLRLSAEIPDLQLVVMRGGLTAELEKKLRALETVRVLDAPLGSALTQVDVVVLPQANNGPSSVQLPAKYCDALAAGVPVIASRTTALEELRGPGVSLIDDWGDYDRIETLLTASREQSFKFGHDNREYARRTIGVEVLQAQFNNAVEPILSAHRH